MYLAIANSLIASSLTLAPISIGDLIDKITILRIKTEKIKAPTKLININNELTALLQILNTRITHSQALDNLIEKLQKINATLWEIEDNIRAKENKKDFDIEFIRLARSVYLYNRERHKAKLAINLMTNSALIEEKQYTEFK